MRSHQQVQLSADLKKYIFSFLLNGNLDVLFTDRYDGSTLSIIRGVSKEWKQLAERWKKPLDEFKQDTLIPLFAQKPEFKNFFKRIIRDGLGNPNFRVRAFFRVNDVLHPILTTMTSSVSTKQLIPFLKEILLECHQWNNSEDLPKESKENNNEIALINGKRKLRKFYHRLSEFAQSDESFLDKSICLRDYQHQFKYLLLERIVYIMLKNSISATYSAMTNDSTLVYQINKSFYDGINEKKMLLGDTARSKDTACCMKSFLLSCVLPLAIVALVTGLLLPDGNAKEITLGVTISFSSLCACCICLMACVRHDYQKSAQASERFRERFFRDMEGYKSLPEPNPDAELRLDIP